MYLTPSIVLYLFSKIIITFCGAIGYQQEKSPISGWIHHCIESMRGFAKTLSLPRPFDEAGVGFIAQNFDPSDWSLILQRTPSIHCVFALGTPIAP